MLENLSFGLKVTIIAMLIVLMALLVVQIMIKLQSFIFRTNKKGVKAAEKPSVPLPTNIALQESNITITDSREKEEEVVAAIMAAISSISGVPTSLLEIKSIKRIAREDLNWRRQSL